MYHKYTLSTLGWYPFYLSPNIGVYTLRNSSPLPYVCCVVSLVRNLHPLEVVVDAVEPPFPRPFAVSVHILAI